MNPRFSASRYAGTAATAVWSLGWIGVASAALQRLDQSGADSGLGNLAVAAVLAVIGLMVTVRSARHLPAAGPEVEPHRERLARRIEGWVATIVWCGGGFVWNIAVFGTLIRAAGEGRTLTLLIMIPFSLIGWFLLLVIFTTFAFLIDSLLHIEQPAVSAPLARPSNELPVSPSTQTMGRSLRDILKSSPVLGALVLISFLNWFVFFGTSLYFGGDALGTLPSRDGFVVTSHGHQTVVSETVWRFSLFYSGATLLATPLIWLTFGVREFGSQLKQARRWKALLICGFLLVWIVGWYSSIGSSLSRSIHDWQKYKRPNHVAAPTNHPPRCWRRIQPVMGYWALFMALSLVAVGQLLR
jgi:hypothetical protein